MQPFLRRWAGASSFAEVVRGTHPVNGMSPWVQPGLYNPRRGAKATVSLGGVPVAAVSFSAGVARRAVEQLI